MLIALLLSQEITFHNLPTEIFGPLATRTDTSSSPHQKAPPLPWNASRDVWKLFSTLHPAGFPRLDTITLCLSGKEELCLRHENAQSQYRQEVMFRYGA